LKNNINYLNKIEEIIEQKRKADPFCQEYNKLFNEIFPVKQFEDVYRLGSAHMLSFIKNEMSKYLCRDCNEYIDELIKVSRTNEITDKYLNVFIKK